MFVVDRVIMAKCCDRAELIQKLFRSAPTARRIMTSTPAARVDQTHVPSPERGRDRSWRFGHGVTPYVGHAHPIEQANGVHGTPVRLSTSHLFCRRGCRHVNLFAGAPSGRLGMPMDIATGIL